MTGLRTWRRGVSLRNESTIACRMIEASKSERVLTELAMAVIPSLRRDQRQVLDDGAERQRRDERQRADQDHHADQQPHEQWRVRRERAGADRNDLLPGQ